MALPTNREPIIESLEVFDKSLLFEFLKPSPSLQATVLMRATYRNSHPLTKLGKTHPQAPPFHLHFSQSESFAVISGRVGTTIGYECKDTIWTVANTWDRKTPHEIKPWTPHRFFPISPDHPAKDAAEEKAAREDAVLLVWAHPQTSANLADGGADMDYLFFRNLIMLASDMHEGQLRANSGLSMLGALGAIFTMQEASDSALVLLPGLSFLAGLRWWVPWKMQQGVVAVWRWSGGRRDGLVEAYTPKKEWAMLKQAQAKKEL